MARHSEEAPLWEKAYEQEEQRHREFRTFQYVNATDVPADALVVPAVVTFTYKHAPDGTVLDYKARFPYPGNRLVPGMHYNPEELAMYAADRDAVRLLLTISARLGLTAQHLDLKSAFLHEDYAGQSALYMKPIPRFDGTNRHSGKVAKVAKNIYGTPNAPRIYVNGLKKHLGSKNYTPLKSDSSVYSRRDGQDVIWIAITIDDFLVTSNAEHMYEQLITD